MRYALYFLFLFPSLGFAQSPGEKDLIFSLNTPGSPAFQSCGLVTRVSPNLLENISNACFQSTYNLYFDDDSSMLRRGGFSQYNLTACTGAQAVRGLWPFNATNGTKYIIAYSSMSMYYSAGDGTCSMINPSGSSYWGLSSTAEMQCVQSQGYLWCGNGTDAPFRTDIVSSQTISGAPTGPLMGAFRNRILIGGVSGNLTKIYLSGELNGLDWTLPTVQYTTSPAIISINGVNDGIKANCFMGEFQNQFLIGRDYDLYALSGYSLADFTVRKLSNQIGCIEPKSVQEVNNQLLWMSKRGMEALSGTQITPISYYIRPTINKIIAASGNSRSQTFTTQVDWQGGNLSASGPGAPMNATISPGNVIASSWSYLDNSATTFNLDSSLTNLDTATITNTIILSSVTYAEPFTNGDPTTDALLWTKGNGDVSFDSSNGACGSAGADLNDQLYTNVIKISSGQWNFSFYYINANGDNRCQPSSNGCVRLRFAQNAGGSYYYLLIRDGSPEPALKDIRIGSVTASGVDTSMASGSLTVNRQVNALFSVVMASSGYINVYGNGSLIATGYDTSITSSTRLEFDFARDNAGKFSNCVKNFSYLSYRQNGTLTSKIFDTALSTPTWGVLSSTFSVNQNLEGQVVFNTRVSTSPNNDMWDAYVASSDTLKVTSAQKRYIQYQSILTTFISTKTPSLSSVFLSAETTGYYITPCVTVSTPTSWGVFNVDAVTNGGSFTFWISTGATCAIATAVNATWTQQSPNSQIVVTTNTANVAARVLFTVDSATETPTLNDVTFNWNSGSNRPPVASVQYNDRYYLFYTTNTVGSPVNDHALVYDYNNRWTLFDDINAYSATLYLNQPFIGDSNATGRIYQLESGQSDNGANFTYSFQTGDLSFGSPAERKDFERLYIYVNSPVQSAQSISLACNYSLDGSSVTYSLNSYPLSNAPQGAGYSVAKFQFPTGQPSTGHWLNVSCSYTGNTGPVRVYGMQMAYKKSSWE